MKKLVIVGARAMGRETFTYARECGMSVKGFLDSKFDALEGFKGYPPILNSVEGYSPEPDDVFVVALGDPECKNKYIQIIDSKGGRFVSIVHPTVYMGDNVRIGKGCIICPHSIITNDSIVGDHVIVNIGTTINHDCCIGRGTTICPGCHLAGRVVIGESVFIGIGATVIPDVVLGDSIYVAAGATVIRSCASGRLIGVPAVCK